MAKYFKSVEGGYITAICTGRGETEITQEEYESILAAIQSRPTLETGYDYKLREDLTWERVEAPAEPADDDISDEEALDIILGGDS